MTFHVDRLIFSQKFCVWLNLIDKFKHQIFFTILCLWLSLIDKVNHQISKKKNLIYLISNSHLFVEKCLNREYYFNLHTHRSPFFICILLNLIDKFDNMRCHQQENIAIFLYFKHLHCRYLMEKSFDDIPCWSINIFSKILYLIESYR